MDDYVPIIIDGGTATIKAGFATDALPTVIIPSAIEGMMHKTKRHK